MTIRSALQGLYKSFKPTSSYLLARLKEGSTYGGIGAIVLANYQLETPWSYILIGLGVIGVILPTKKETPVNGGE